MPTLSQAESPSQTEPETEEPATTDTPKNRSGAEETADTLPLDQVFAMLKNERRRFVLQYLRERDEPVTMSELSERIAAWETGKDIQQLKSGERKRVYVALYQCHLPKMDDMDIIEYNKPRGTIKSDKNAHLFDEYLGVEQSEQLPWYRYYAGLAVVGMGLFGSTFIGTEWLVGTELLLGIVIIAFLCCSCLHTYMAHTTNETAEDATHLN